MKKIIVLVAFFLFSGLATTHAYEYYTDNTWLNPPPVLCSNCHSDGRTWAMFHNLYDSGSSSVHFPVIYVGGTYYAADLALVQSQPTLRFRVENLQTASQTTSIPFTSIHFNSARVTYNDVTTQLVIPNVTVGTQNFSVTLLLVPSLLPDIQFDLQ